MCIRDSYNTVNGVHGTGGTPLRANYPGGTYNEDDPWYYDTTNNLFRKDRPTDKDGESCTSWTLNKTKGEWEPPITKPTETRAEIEAGESSRALNKQIWYGFKVRFPKGFQHIDDRVLISQFKNNHKGE